MRLAPKPGETQMLNLSVIVAAKIAQNSDMAKSNGLISRFLILGQLGAGYTLCWEPADKKVYYIYERLPPYSVKNNAVEMLESIAGRFVSS